MKIEIGDNVSLLIVVLTIIGATVGLCIYFNTLAPLLIIGILALLLSTMWKYVWHLRKHFLY